MDDTHKYYRLDENFDKSPKWVKLNKLDRFCYHAIKNNYLCIGAVIVGCVSASILQPLAHLVPGPFLLQMFIGVPILLSVIRLGAHIVEIAEGALEKKYRNVFYNIEEY